MFKLLYYIKALYFANCIDRMRELVILNINLYSIYNLLVIVLKILFFAHIFACFWHKLGEYYLINENNGWLMHYDLQY